MSRPQQPELARSAKTDLDPDHVETGLQGQRKPRAGGETGPVPPENEPGHHPPEEQDKPDLDKFAARLGADPKAAKAASSAEREPRLVGLMLLPLRQTVKGLEQLDRTLTERLSRKLRARGGRGPKGR
ncbi:MAG: hypothetical protein ACRDYF_06730 [Acidimicrobiia bacterium]